MMDSVFMIVWYALAVVSVLVVGMEWIFHAEPGKFRIIRRNWVVVMLVVLFVAGYLGAVL